LTADFINNVKEYILNEVEKNDTFAGQNQERRKVQKSYDC